MGSASVSMLLFGILIILIIDPISMFGHRITSQSEVADKSSKKSNHQQFTADLKSVAGMSYTKSLPSDFRLLRSSFHELMETDPSMQKPLKPGKRTLFMGVPVRLERADVRITIRRSWMSQPGICRVTTGFHKAEADKSCALYTSFVVGGISNSTGLPLDCIVGQDCFPVQEEGDLSKKTRAFFRKALKEFQWATHIGKIDTDVFPRFYKVLPVMPEGQYSLIGDMLDNFGCGGKKFCPPDGCGKSIGGNLLQYKIVEGKTCWTFPQGGLYILSRDLASGAFDEEIQSALPNTGGNEDLMVGWAAHEYARRKNVQARTLTEEVQAQVWGKMWSHMPWTK
eukprot:TRINITY_DN17099_c0_g1_i1.p1 TRINITY_DN17099_c0_g1~~TRINITY_DN17099_c0_g1_i1.p1  ORF type:complete len:339 (+),score=20.93 TRINITY_DN17099_c0_g1_i1:76-1092(+)